MLDCILYVPDFMGLVTHLNANHPEMLQRDEEGNMAVPPVVTGFARTPAVVNGNAVLVYARLRDEQVEQWRDMPGVEVLAETPYTGKGTSDAVYKALFADADASAKYDSVYDRSPQTFTDEDGQEYTTTPPEKFGVMA